LLDGVLQDKFSGFMVPCVLASRGLSKRLFFELPPGSFGLYFPPLALFLFQPMPQFLGFSPQPIFLPAPGLLFLPLVPGQTLLHGPFARFQGPLHDRHNCVWPCPAGKGRGYRCIAHDRRGHGRASQLSNSNGSL